MESCCKNRKYTLGCWKGLGDNSTTPRQFHHQVHDCGRLIFKKENITIHGIDFTYKENVSPFAYIYVTENGEEALISYNKFRRIIRGSFDLNDGRSFAFHPCFVYCLTRTERNISKEYTVQTLACYPEYVFYEYDQNYLRKAFKKVVKFVKHLSLTPLSKM